MKKLFYLLPIALLLAACSNSMIDTSAIEKKVTSMEEDASKLRQVYDNFTEITDNLTETEQKVEEAKSQDVLDTIKRLNTEYEAFKDLIDTTSIKKIKERTEKNRDIFNANKPTHQALNTEAKDLETKINNHIEISQTDDDRIVKFTPIQDGLIHTSHYNGDGIRTSESIYNNGNLVETKVYSPNGVNVIKSTKYNDAGKRESVIEYNEDGSKKSQIFFKDGEPVGNIQFSSLDFNTFIRGFATWDFSQLSAYDGCYGFHIQTNYACGGDEGKCGNVIGLNVERYVKAGTNPKPMKDGEAGADCEGVYEYAGVLNITGSFHTYAEFDESCKIKCWLYYKDAGDIQDVELMAPPFLTPNPDHICSDEAKNRFKTFLKDSAVLVLESVPEIVPES